MKGSLHIATVGGIPVKIHWSFGLLLLYIAFDTSRDGFDPLAILIAIVIVLSVFFCVILHEFGHAIAARRYGVKTHDILMTPVGGIARLERMPEGKGQEFWVAIAGPVVNFIIVGLIWLGYLIIEHRYLPIFSPSLWTFQNQPPSYFIILMMANGYLGLFNLLPAFPMDGGRMLRSLLSLRMDRAKATQIAAYTGQALAVVLFLLGLINAQPTLALIGVFIFFTARQENLLLQRQTRLNTANAAGLMDPINHVVFLGHTLEHVMEITKDVPGNSFVVWSRPSIPAGYITRERMNAVYDTQSHDSLIDPWVIPAPVVVGPDASAKQVVSLMQGHKIPILLVADWHGYIGMIPWEKVEKTFY